jgi:hypothetical protein
MGDITATDMIEALRRHYLPEGRPAGGLFADEIASPDGARRADLIWVPTNLAGIREACIVGHEVKVSRSDVISELNDPTKSDPWAQYCDRWWLTIPDPALIEGLTIPTMWGIMSLPSGRKTRSMTVLREAPKLTPHVNLGPAMTRIAGYIVNRMEIETRRLEHQLGNAERETNHANARLEDVLSGSEIYNDPRAKRIRFIMDEFEKRTEETKRLGWYTRDAVLDEMIISSMIDYRASTIAARDARNQAKNLSRVLNNDLLRPILQAKESLDLALAIADDDEKDKD